MTRFILYLYAISFLYEVYRMNSGSYEQKTAESTKNHERIFLRAGINRFPERLKEAMEAAGVVSNVQLARHTELSESTIRKYLKGDTYPTLDRLALLSDACSCSPAWLATGEGDAKYQTSLHTEDLVNKNDASPSEIDRILSYLSEEQKEKFLKVIYTKGIGAILRLDDGVDSQFLSLPEDEKERLLRLNEQVKKGASITSEVSNQNDPTQQKTGSS